MNFNETNFGNIFEIGSMLPSSQRERHFAEFRELLSEVRTENETKICCNRMPPKRKNNCCKRLSKICDFSKTFFVSLSFWRGERLDENNC